MCSKKTTDWGLVFERLSGSYDQHQPTCVQRYLYGSKIESSGWNDDYDVEAKFSPGRVPDKAHGKTLPLEIDGVTVKGPKGALKLDAKKIASRSLEPELACEMDGDAGYNLRLRAHVAAFPGAFFTKPEALADLFKIPDAIVLCDTTAFAHAVGKRRPKRAWHIAPSASKTYRSLVKAIALRDRDAFEPGESNLDFRLHAIHRL